jgi:hypothetical protein
MLIDFLTYYKEILKCRIFQIFSENDPYYFYMENIILFVTSIMLLFYAPINVFLQFVVSDYYIIIDSILKIFLYLMNITHLYLFATILTIFGLCKVKKHEINDELLDFIYKNDELYEMFLKYSIKEWSSENVLLYKDIIHFNNIVEYDLKLEYAHFIEKNYLNYTLSPMEINIDHSSITIFKSKLKNINEENILLLFDEVRTSVKTNLDDTLSRFRFSNDFLVFKKNYDYLQKNIVL